MGAAPAERPGADRFGLHLEKIEQIFDVERLFGDVVQAGKQALDQAAGPCESAGQERQDPNRQIAPSSVRSRITM